MKRLPDWQSRFAAVIRQRYHAPFEWGKNDCCTFAAACVQAITGLDPMATLVYENERAAKRLIQEGGGLPQMIAARIGPEVSPKLARQGDIGIWIQPERGETLAVHAGVWLSTGEAGLVVVPASSIARVWRVC